MFNVIETVFGKIIQLNRNKSVKKVLTIFKSWSTNALDNYYCLVDLIIDKTFKVKQQITSVSN